MRQLLEKIEENSKFIERERSKISFSLSDSKVVVAWEAQISAAGTPLQAFYENWSKINRIQKRKKVTKNDEIAGELPMIKRKKFSEDTANTVKSDNKGPLVLFPSDSEDEKDNFILEEDHDQPKPKKKLKKKKDVKKKNNKKIAADVVDDVMDKDDVVQDLSVNDW